MAVRIAQVEESDGRILDQVLRVVTKRTRAVARLPEQWQQAQSLVPAAAAEEALQLHREGGDPYPEVVEDRRQVVASFQEEGRIRGEASSLGAYRLGASYHPGAA